MSKIASFLTEDKSVPQNVRDEAANVVLACTITALFLVKNKDIPVNLFHVKAMLQYVSRKPEYNFNSKEASSDTHDQIIMRTPVSEDAREYLFGRDHDTNMILSIIEFVNNYTDFNDLVKSVTNNGMQNQVIIDVGDLPFSTSVTIDNIDIRLDCNVLPIYDYRPNIGGIGKRELKKDYGYESHSKFFKRTFNIDIGHTSAVYCDTAHNTGTPTVTTIEAATRQLYNSVCTRLNNGLRGAYDTPLHDYKHALITSMLECSYGVKNDSDTFCVMLDGKAVGYNAFNAKYIYKTLYNTKMTAKCPSHMNPSIRIVGDKHRELFQVRFKKERHENIITDYRYKMYFKPTGIKEYF